MSVPGPAYAELHVTTNYSFLRGASHVEVLLVAARALGLRAMAVTDHNTWPASRPHARAEEAGMELVVGYRFDLQGSLPVLGGTVQMRQLADLAQAARVPTTATGDVLHHISERWILQDVVTCIPASARAVPSTMPGSAASGSPTGTSGGRARWRGCSRGIIGQAACS